MLIIIFYYGNSYMKVLIIFIIIKIAAKIPLLRNNEI